MPHLKNYLKAYLPIDFLSVVFIIKLELFYNILEIYLYFLITNKKTWKL